MAHEIKNPLNSISLHARDTSELLAETPLDFSLMQENLSTIEQSVMRIDRIVLDLMDTVSIEQGRLALSLQLTDLASLLQIVRHDYEHRQNAHTNRLLLQLPETLPKISVDPERLIQVLDNLISNAERHTNHGTITISLSRGEHAQVICVSDTGSGMSKEMQKMHSAAMSQRIRITGGMASGLYVCHQIVTAHGGSIWIESREGTGTRVFFSLPEDV